MTAITTSINSSPGNLRDALVAQHGLAVGDAMYNIQLDARRMAADHARCLQAQLAAINAQNRCAIEGERTSSAFIH